MRARARFALAPASPAAFCRRILPASLFARPPIPLLARRPQESRGAQFHPELVREVPTDVIVRKGTHRATDSYSGFGDASATKAFEKTHLEDALRAADATDVVVLGLATDFCVSFTCKDAAACGFRTWCVLDGSRHIAPDSLASELAAMRAAGCHLVTAADVSDILAAPSREAAEELAARLDARELAAVAAALGAK